MAKLKVTMLISSMIASGLLASCSSTGGYQSNSESVNGSQSSYQNPQFNYVTDGGEEWGLVQAFTVDGNLHIQFLDIERVNPFFIDGKGQDLAFHKRGAFAVIKGAPLEVHVASHFGRAKVYSTKIKAIQRAAAPIKQKLLVQQEVLDDPSLSAAEHPATSTSDMETNLAKLKADKAEIDREIDSLESALSLAKSQLAEIESMATLLKSSDVFIGEQGAIIHRVYFDDYSTNVDTGILDSDAVMDASKKAEKIIVRGFTDSFSSSETATRLALSRSVNVRDYLVGKGVDGSKIRAMYRSYDNFLVENVGANKRFNRRVEIIYSFPKG